MSVRQYYELAKPGIIYGNLFVAAGAFFMGAVWNIDPIRFLAMLGGLGLIIGCSAVINNYYDRDIDAAMARTRTRVSVTGEISPRNMLLFALVLGVLGSVLLDTFVNHEAFAAALFGLAVYIGPYTLIAKRGSVFGTFIGGIAGAMPPVVGYVAAVGHFDLIALIVFLILVFWQMPHAYAIALYRFDDYKAANIPVLPVARGIQQTKVEMLAYVILFGLAAAALAQIATVGLLYRSVAVVISLAWLALAIAGFYTSDWKRWGRRMFFASLIALMVLFFVMAIDPAGAPL